jgi:hypothetical protein
MTGKDLFLGFICVVVVLIIAGYVLLYHWFRKD